MPVDALSFATPMPSALAPLAELIHTVAQPGIALSLGARGPAPVGASKLGGKPDLPDGVAPPRSDHGKPLPFAFQLNLEEAQALCPGVLSFSERPGLLQFWTTFVTPSETRWPDGFVSPDGGENQLVFQRNLGSLQRHEAAVPALDETLLIPKLVLTLPGTDELDAFGEAAEALWAALRADPRACELYQEWVTDLAAPHQLGGFVRWLQGPAELEASARAERLTYAQLWDDSQPTAAEALRERLSRDLGRWCVLSRVSSLLGDDGAFYVLAPVNDEGAYVPERAQFVYQCT